MNIDMQIDLLTFGVFKTAIELALVSGVLLGITGLFSKMIPDSWRDIALPTFAMILGVGLSFLTQISHGDPVSFVGFCVGVVFGGSVTGLYAVKKEMKQTPNVVVNR